MKETVVTQDRCKLPEIDDCHCANFKGTCATFEGIFYEDATPAANACGGHGLALAPQCDLANSMKRLQPLMSTTANKQTNLHLLLFRQQCQCEPIPTYQNHLSTSIHAYFKTPNKLYNSNVQATLQTLPQKPCNPS